MAKYFIAIKERFNSFWDQEKIELNFWHAFILICIVSFIYVLSYVIFGLLFKNSFRTFGFTIFLDFFSVLLYIPVIVWSAKKTSINIKDALYIPYLDKILRIMLIITLAAIVVLQPFSHGLLFLTNLFNGKLRILGGTFRPWFLYDIRLVIIGPIIEEFFFRGIVLKNFLKKYSPVYAILLSSILFAAYHHDIDKLVLLTFMGILFGVIYYTSNSLILASLAHISWNTISLLQYEYIELNTTTSIIHLSIYIIATVWLVYLLKKDWKNDNNNVVITDIKS